MKTRTWSLVRYLTLRRNDHESWSCWCKVLFPFFSCHLPLLEHVHELDAGNGTLCRVKRFEPEPRTGHPLALVGLPVASDTVGEFRRASITILGPVLP
jgi:hypothetical protein